MYAPGCLIQRLAELQAPGTGRRVAGGGWQEVLEMVAGAVKKSKSDIVLSTPAVSLYTE